MSLHHLTSFEKLPVEWPLPTVSFYCPPSRLTVIHQGAWKQHEKGKMLPWFSHLSGRKKEIKNSAVF